MNSLNPKSSLQYKLLISFYKKYDIDNIENNRIKKEIIKGTFEYKELKDIFFKKLIKKFNTIKCQVCGTENLQREKGTCNTIETNKLATIEHVIPISEGGLKYNIKNFICTCSNCNNKRGRLPLIKINEFMYAF